METVTGIFRSRTDAERAAEQLRSQGIAEDKISLLAPGATDEQVEAAVPTTETEQPGMGGALGGAVGGALGVAGGLHLGAAAASFFIPGVGPVLAAGIIGAALLGAGGAAAGAAAGSAAEGTVAGGLPHDEIYVYEDALRQGRTVIIAVVEDDQAEVARVALSNNGAESIDAAREQWWVGLRDAEEAVYSEEGGDFTVDEGDYRSGFVAALHPLARGKNYDDDQERLRECYGGACSSGAFRRGYARGRGYQTGLEEKFKS